MTTTMAELVEADVDWFADLTDLDTTFARVLTEMGGPKRNRPDLVVKNMPYLIGTFLREPSHNPKNEADAASLLDGDLLSGRQAGHRLPSSNVSLGQRFMRELYALLCGVDNAYNEERKKLLSECRAGQTTVAASVASVLTPVIGTTGPAVATATAVCLTMIGQIGLTAWCNHYSAEEERRKQFYHS